MADEQKIEEEKPKHPGGRPPMFATADEIFAKVKEYFEWIKGEVEIKEGPKGEKEENWLRYPEPPTITGLTLFIGFESRQSFYDYCDKGGEFAYALQKARTMIECQYEKNLHGTTPTGSIFALKNMGWKDKTEHENYGKDGGPIQQKYEVTLNIR